MTKKEEPKEELKTKDVSPPKKGKVVKKVESPAYGKPPYVT